MKVHPFIEAEKVAGNSVNNACRLLEVSRSAFYARVSNPPCQRTLTDAKLREQIREVHDESKGTYGSPRIHQELAHRDVVCGKNRVARLMRVNGLEGRCKKRYRRTTTPDPSAELARDLIQREFAPGPQINRRYVGDITYISTWQGWAYLATVIDLASRKVVGWALADHMRTELIEAALSCAFLNRRPPKGVVFHSDRGSQGEFNRLSQHLMMMGVLNGASTTGSGSSSAQENEIARASTAATRSRAAVLDRDRQGSGTRGSCSSRRCFPTGGTTSLP